MRRSLTTDLEQWSCMAQYEAGQEVLAQGVELGFSFAEKTLKKRRRKNRKTSSFESQATIKIGIGLLREIYCIQNTGLSLAGHDMPTHVGTMETIYKLTFLLFLFHE